MKGVFLYILFFFSLSFFESYSHSKSHSGKTQKKNSQSHLKKHTRDVGSIANTGNVANSQTFNQLSKLSEIPMKEDNPILQLDAAKGFQRAIQTDFEALNNPTSKDKIKKDAIVIPREAPQTAGTPKSYFTDEYFDDAPTAPAPVTANNTPSGEFVPPADHAEVFELLSKTALHYSEFITEEMRYMAELEVNRDKKNCSTDSTNCGQAGTPTNPNDNNFINKISELSSYQNKNGQEGKPPPDFSKMRCAEWSEWSACNDTCTGGVSLRYRDCYDNENSRTPQFETKPCSNPDCLYCTEWSKFSSCSKICGVGIKVRERLCYLKNGTSFTERNAENCNFHPCQPECGFWSDWTNCSKPCDTGVTIRLRNCSLADGTTKTFYEHHACNTQPCDRSNVSVVLPPNDINHSNSDDKIDNIEDGCISAHLSFEKFQYNVYTVYDDTDEHNDVEYSNLVLFNGNHSCGYSGVLTGRNSTIKFYDDIFRNFEKSDLSVMFWFYPIKTYLVENRNQTLFSLYSSSFDFGKYSFVMTEKNELVFTFQTKSQGIVGVASNVLNDSKWQHVAISFSHDKHLLKLFVNGRKIPFTISQYPTAQVYPGVASYSATSFTHFQAIGNDESLTTPTSAVIDEIYVFKCPLTQSQVYNVANICKSRESVFCPSPLHGLCPKKSWNDMRQEEYIPQMEPVTPLNTYTNHT